MVQKNNYCDEHCEIAHAVLGDGKSNKGHEKRISDIEHNNAFVLGVLATINFIWLFFIYPWISKALELIHNK